MDQVPFSPHSGWLEVICGGMFSGKTEELISRVRRAMFARQKVQIFKPRTDNRYAVDAVVSHTKISVNCIPVGSATDILSLVDDDTALVAIDEVQFFDKDIVDVAQALADRGFRVICAGLDQNAKGEPFEPMPALLCVADRVTKKNAVCMRCGAAASRSQRMRGGEEETQLGAAESYEARCRACHNPEAEIPPL